jgi:uncharacterized damage-inducible protein DinB
MEHAAELTRDFIEFSRQKVIAEMWLRLCSCLDGLNEEQIWWRPHERSNSIGNLLLHLNGNVRQWILHGIGGVPFERHRDAEFEERGPVPATELRHRLDETLQDVDALLGRLTEADLLRKHDIQAYRGVSGMSAIYHVVEHFAMHYGQMLYISKMLSGQDLGFYAHLTGRKQV